MGSATEPRIGRLLGEAYSLWQRETYAALADKGFPEIRPAHSPVFRHIQPEGTRTVDLASRASMTKQSMGYLVSSLAKMGFVELAPDPADARARLVRLTSKGKKANSALASSSRRLEVFLGEHIGADQLDSLRDMLIDLQTCSFGTPDTSN